MKKSVKIALYSFSALGALWLAPQAGAIPQTIIISDSFSGTNGTSLSGRAPDGSNLPSTSYSYATAGDGAGEHPQIDTAIGNPAPGADTGFNDAIWLSIASNGGYTKPVTFTVGVNFEMNTLTGTVSPGFIRGMGLGFWSTANTTGTESSANFTGLTVLPTGTLALIANGTETAATVAPFGGFSTSAFYSLSYTINTVTGSIQSVLFNGNNDTATFSGAASAGDFTNSGTNLAGFYGSSSNETTTGYVDNYVVAPEPSAWLSMIGGLGMLAGCRRFGRKRTA